MLIKRSIFANLQGVTCGNVDIEASYSSIYSAISCDLPAGGPDPVQGTITVNGARHTFDLTYLSDRSPQITLVTCDVGNCMIARGTDITVTIEVSVRRDCSVATHASQHQALQGSICHNRVPACSSRLAGVGIRLGRRRCHFDGNELYERDMDRHSCCLRMRHYLPTQCAYCCPARWKP